MKIILRPRQTGYISRPAVLRGLACSSAVALVLGMAGCRQEKSPASAATESEVPIASDAPASAVPLATAPTVGGTQFNETTMKLDGALPSKLCAVRVNGQKLTVPPLSLNASEQVQIEGWLGDESTSAWPKEQPMLLLEHASSRAKVWRLDLSTPVDRSAVARKLNTPSMRMSGFSLNLDLSAMPRGNYRLYAAHMTDGKLYVCHKGGALTLGK